jgi:uncharacterized membrane protein YkvA (DUF1232 family)
MRARRTVAAKALWDVLLGARRTGGPALGQRLGALPRMLAAALSGHYPHLSRGRLAMMAVALVYVVSPIDIVPEAFLAVLGLGDDALVVAWLAGALLGDAEHYLDWERERRRTVPGRVVG